MSLAKIGKRLLLRHTLVVLSIMLSLFLVRTAQAALLIDDMEAAGKWTILPWCINPVPTLCDTEVKQGTHSLTLSFVNDQDGVYDGAAMCYTNFGTIDLSGYDVMRFWFKTTAAAPAGRTMIYLTDVNGKNVAVPFECLYSALQPNEWYEIVWPFKTLVTYRDNQLFAPIDIDFTQIYHIFFFAEDQRYTGSTNVSFYFDDMKFMTYEEFLIDKDDDTGTDTGKKLICFADGGPTMGTPFTEVVRTNIATMEAQFPAVNGLVLHPSTDGTGWDAFMTHFWSDETMLSSVANPSLDDLANTSFSQYTDNFMRLLTTPPGYADYFDDAAWTALTGKAAIAAKICHDGGLKGIFLDTETYAGYGQPFRYDSQPDSPLYTYEEYAVKARQRGGELMEALRSEYPDITILLPWTQSGGISTAVFMNVITPRMDVYGSLYGPFMDGMLDECGDATFVDACECGYACKTYADFLMWKIIVKYIAPYSSVVPDTYRAKVKLGYGLWFGDGTCNTAQNWIDYASSANPFGAISPEQLSNMIYYAKWIGDSGYTWLYRNPVWNSTNGAYIPQTYLDAIADPHPAYLYTSLTSPENDDVFVSPASITLEATASDTESAVTKVEFFDGATNLGEDTTSPYSCLWNSPAVGTHVLTSVATDSRGFKRTSGAVSIRVDALPTVSITSPAQGSSSSAPATISITASASDSDGTIASVEFYNNGILLGTDNDSAGGWTYSWTNVEASGSNGIKLTAKAYDNDGGSTTSSQVSCSVTDTALKCYWNLDETSGSTANDTSGTGNNGTLYNSPTHTAGKINYGLSLNGSSQYVYKSTATGLPNTDATQTKCFWFYISDSTPTDTRVALAVTFSTLSTGNGLNIGFINSGGEKFAVWRNTNKALIVSTGTLPAANAWHHVAYVKSGSTNYLYIDGAQVDSNTNTTDSGLSAYIYAGRTNGGNNYWPGKLDEIRLYNRALSATEIAALAQGEQ